MSRTLDEVLCALPEHGTVSGPPYRKVDGLVDDAGIPEAIRGVPGGG
ncbi:hypothetical protein FHX34_103898 [Actinoplanes teichomyceticus]|uniref:Uncharacterized protein n=1 Tax=Actinoplanes teichomyceticus TaxID=1867 RepID=A0A561WBV9_ACTTI|nr:hypothetical protein FHX34_103898 [Actinoplanes teichomyceticus]GIF16445.1 hypothetical protein Ate01nite_64770 [Actinoplanes teichomyceticus]